MTFVKLYGSILDSSVWGESKDTRLVWITLLAMADAEGFVEAAMPGLARRANVTIEECEAAVAALEAPDPYSKSKEHDGRRIERVRRGFLVLNYEAYREMRTARQIDNAERKRNQRERDRNAEGDDRSALLAAQRDRCDCCGDPLQQPFSQFVVWDHDHETGAKRGLVCRSCNKHIGLVESGRESSIATLVSAYLLKHGQGGVTSHRASPSVTEVTEVSASASAFGSVVPKDQKPVRREGHIELAEWMAKRDFGRFASIVQGYIASQRSAVAVMATFEMHLTGEMEHEKATPEQLGLAVQQYSANEGGQRFSARYFAGFVRDVKKQVERGGRRKANAAEEKHIQTEAGEAAQRAKEEAEGKMVNAFRESQPERFAELQRIAEDHVPKKFSGDTREYMVHAKLVDLIRREGGDAR